MRYIIIYIDDNGKVTLNTTALGYGGEHNAKTLSVIFTDYPNSPFNIADYFRVVINGHFSEKIYSEDEVEGSFTYPIPQECVVPPSVNCQIIGYKADDNADEPSVIIKTETFSLTVECSESFKGNIGSTPDIFEKALHDCEDYAKFTSEQVILAEQHATIAIDSAEQSNAHKKTCSELAEQANISAENAAASAEILSRQEKYINIIGNALQKVKSGKVVAINDTSPIEQKLSVKLTTNDGTALDGTTLNVCGKNLIKTDNVSYWSAVGWSTQAKGILLPLKVGVTYTFSYDYNELPTYFSFVTVETNNPSVKLSEKWFTIEKEINRQRIITPEEGYSYYIVSSLSYNAMTNTVLAEWLSKFKYMQLEIGSVATDYEPHIEPQSYQPNEDGTVDNVMSLFPNMTLQTDNSNVQIEAQYSRDINKAFQELTEAIISLGGNI